MLSYGILSWLRSILSLLLQNVAHPGARNIPNFQINRKKSNGYFSQLFF